MTSLGGTVYCKKLIADELDVESLKNNKQIQSLLYMGGSLPVGYAIESHNTPATALNLNTASGFYTLVIESSRFPSRRANGH